MLRPERGEGERPAHNFKALKKGPLFITAAFLASLPVCMAQEAIALTSSYDANAQRLQPQQTAQRTQLQSLPRTSQGLLLQPSLALPSATNVQYLESTVTSYKAQLSTLKNAKPLDPTLQPQIDQQIEQLEIKIKSLEATVQKVRNNFKLYGIYKANYESAVKTYNEAILNEATSKTALLQATSNKNSAHTQLLTQQEATQHALTILNSTSQDVRQLQGNVYATTETLNSATEARDSAQLTKDQTAQTKATAQGTFNEASAQLSTTTLSLQTAQTNKAAAQQQLTSAQQQLNTAQYNYDHNLISDPSWIRPTIQVQHRTLVPHTTQVANTTTRLVSSGLTATTYNRNGYNASPPLPGANETPLSTMTVPNINFDWGSGAILNSGRSEDLIVKFTGYIAAPTSGYYQFYAPADDGVYLYVNNQLIINDWYDKGGGGSLSTPVYLTAGQPVPITLYFYENGGGANVWLYTYDPYSGFQIVPASWFGSQYVTETTYTTVTTYEEVITYTTEPDPNATAPLIHDPALQQVLSTSQQTYDSALATYNEAVQAEQEALAAQASAQGNYDTANTDLQSATSADNTATEELTSAEQTYSAALTAKNNAQTQLDNSSTDKTTAQQNYDAEVAKLSTATTSYEAASAEETTAQAAYTTSAQNLNTATTNEQVASEDLTTSEQTLSTSYTSATTAADPDSYNFSSVNTLLKTEPAPPPTPEPEPEPEPEPTPAEELPAEVTADNLTQIDFAAVDTSTITPEQADQLKEAALEIFATAEEGSPEYEAALDALYLAATEDDIEVPQELAAVPVLGAAVQGVADAINFLGNAGADLSPKVREESQKIVVSALVVGQVAQIGSAAAMSSASSSFRRK